MKKLKRKMAEGPRLTDVQAGFGARYLASANMGEPPPKGGFKDLQQLVFWCRRVEQNHAIEGCPLDEEIRTWLKELRAHDKFSVETVRKELPFLFEEVTG